MVTHILHKMDNKNKDVKTPKFKGLDSLSGGEHRMTRNESEVDQTSSEMKKSSVSIQVKGMMVHGLYSIFLLF